MTITTLRNFTADGGLYGKLVAGASLVGHGRAGQTTFRLAPKSSTRKKLVPTKAGTTNPLYVMKFSGRDDLVVRDFAVEGTPQGHLFNGVRIDRSAHVSVRELRISGIPGGSDINPGETFLLNLYRCTNVAVADTELDGDGIGASGLGLNTCQGGLDVRDVTAHDLKYCKGAALWKQQDGGRFTNFQSLNNAFAFGFERCDGLFLLDRVKFRGSRRADIHLANDGGQYGRAKVSIVDPDLAPGQRIKVLLSKLEIGKPNKQTRSDVEVVVHGKSRPDLLQFVTKA